LWEELGSALANLLRRRKIVGHEPNYGADRYRRETPFVEIALQRLYDQIEKVIEGTSSFDVYRLAVTHHRLLATANWLAAAAKDLTQSDRKNLIGAIGCAAGLPGFLNGCDRSACCLCNIRLCRLFDLSWKT
jgi:hypothetical protein